MLLCIPLLIKDERHYVSVITITKVGWNKRKHPVSLSLLLITAGRRKGSVFFNKAGVLYASTSYLPQHLWTVKVSSPLLLNPLIVLYLPHSTAAHSTRAAKTKLEALCTSLDSAALLFSSWKDTATSFPLASPPRSISSLLTSVATVSLKAWFPQGREAEVGPYKSLQLQQGLCGVLYTAMCLASPSEKHPLQQHFAMVQVPTHSRRKASPANAWGVQIMNKGRNSLPRVPPQNGTGSDSSQNCKS